jgi:thioredoxin-like negative regulator of GroEL
LEAAQTLPLLARQHPQNMSVQAIYALWLARTGKSDAAQNIINTVKNNSAKNSLSLELLNDLLLEL